MRALRRRTGGRKSADRLPGSIDQSAGGDPGAGVAGNGAGDDPRHDRKAGGAGGAGPRKNIWLGGHTDRGDRAVRRDQVRHGDLNGGEYG